MAAKSKKVATRTRGNSRNKQQPAVATGIPEGFTMPASANTPFHDFQIAPVLQGTRIAVREFARKKVKKGEKKTMQIMTVRANNGELVAVSDSHALLGLFDESKNGDEIFIRKDGQKKLPGGHKVNLFTTAFNAKEKAPSKAKKR